MALTTAELALTVGAPALATLVGPFIALRLQKILERRDSLGERKRKLFEALMATRPQQSRTTEEHERALNMIEVTYHGGVTRWLGGDTGQEQKVLAAWTSYRTALDTNIDQYTPGDQDVFVESRNKLFVDMLMRMAEEAGYGFERHVIEHAHYSRQRTIELTQQRAIQTATKALLEGAVPLWIAPVPPQRSAGNSENDQAARA